MHYFPHVYVYLTVDLYQEKKDVAVEFMKLIYMEMWTWVEGSGAKDGLTHRRYTDREHSHQEVDIRLHFCV